MFSKMNKRKKRIVKRVNAGSLAAILILSAVLSLNVFMGNDNMVYAAESSEMGTNSYTTGITGGAALTVGSTYTLGGNAKTSGSATPQAQVLAISGKTALMQSLGLWGGTWPGSGELSSTAATYFGDLKNAISNVYLPQGTAKNAETVYWQGAQTSAYTEIYHLYHSTNQDLFEGLLSVYQLQNKDILASGRTENGFFILEDKQGIRFEYYLPFGRRGIKRLYKIRSYVEDMECLTDKYNADYAVLIMDDKAEQKIILFHKLHPEHHFEFWKRRSACQYAISKGS